MPKGHYTVQEGSDSSFRSCVCLLLIFLCICCIVIVVSFTTYNKGSVREHKDSPSSEASAGSAVNTSVKGKVSVRPTARSSTTDHDYGDEDKNPEEKIISKTTTAAAATTTTTTTTTTPVFKSPSTTGESILSSENSSSISENITTDPLLHENATTKSHTEYGKKKIYLPLSGNSTVTEASTAETNFNETSTTPTSSAHSKATELGSTLLPSDKSGASPTSSTDSEATTPGSASSLSDESGASLTSSMDSEATTPGSTLSPSDESGASPTSSTDSEATTPGSTLSPSDKSGASPTSSMDSEATTPGSTLSPSDESGASPTSSTDSEATMPGSTLSPSDESGASPTSSTDSEATAPESAPSPSDDSGASPTSSTDSEVTTPVSTILPSDKSGTTPTSSSDSRATTPHSTSSPLVKPERADKEEDNVCGSLDCKRLGARSLSLMSLDERVNKCENFYDFACGGLQLDPFLLPHNYWADVWEQIEDEAKNVTDEDPVSYKKFREYLKSCEEDTANETDWTELVKQELVDFEFTSEKKNFTHIFTQLILRDSPLFFDVQLDIKTYSSSSPEFTFRVIPADVTENAFDFTKTEVKKCEARASPKETNLTTSYRHIVDCLKNDGLALILSDAEKALNYLYNDSKNDFQLSLETIVGEINNETLGMYGGDHRAFLQKREFDDMTVEELDEIFPLVKWEQLLNGLTTGPFRGTVHVYNKEYLRNVYNTLYKHDDESIAEALQAWFLTTRLRQLLQPSPDARGRFFCSHRAASLMRGVASALYLRSFHPDYLQKLDSDVFTIYREIKDHLEKNVMNKIIKEKVSKITPSIFNNGTSPESEELEIELEKYEISESDFLKNSIHLMYFHRRNTYNRVGKDPNDFIWTHFLQVFDVRGLSIYELDTIAIPLGMLAKPFFHPEYPLYAQYAGLGFEIAHQLAHLFDWTGIRYEDGEKTVDVVYERDISRLGTFLSDKVSGEYVSYELKENHAKDNEYFADLSGLALAYHTYQDARLREKRNFASLPYLNLTTSQAFFVHAAQKFCTRVPLNEMVLDLFEDVHFPPPFRVARLTAIDIFHKTFNCSSVGTPAFPYILNDLAEDS